MVKIGSRYLKRKYYIPTVFVLIFAIIGVLLLFLSHAATPNASIDLGTNTPGTGVSTHNAGSASGGSYIQFGSGSQTCTSNCGGDGTLGSVLYQPNFINPTSPLVNTYGTKQNGPQAGNWNQASTYFSGGGKWYWDGVAAHQSLATQWSPNNGAALQALGGWTKYVHEVVPVPPNPGCPSSTGVIDSIPCGHEEVNFNPANWSTNKVGETDYESYGFYVPSAGLPLMSQAGNPPMIEVMNWDWTVNSLNARAIGMQLVNNDHVSLDLDSGPCLSYGTGVGGGGNQCTANTYHSNVDGYPGHPTGSTLVPSSSSQISNFYAIPPGHITNGAWNEIICKINFEVNATGSVTCWYRTPGNAWVQSANFSGVATLGATTSGVASAAHNDGPDLYTSSMTTAPYPLDATGGADATGFAAAASTLP